MTRASPGLPAAYHDSQMAAPEQCGFLGGTVCVYSARCPGKGSPNEDSAVVVPFDDTSGVLVVADGMGGHAAGEVASRIAIEEMVSAVTQAYKAGGLLRGAIINGFERANEAVKGLCTGAGTTLAAVELSEGCARPYHTGDSVILVVGSRGKIKLETISHSPVGYAVEAGFLDDNEAMHHEDRHLILNVVGSDQMRIEIGSSVKLAKQDTVLLASDGLTDNVLAGEITEFIRKGPLATSVRDLVSICEFSNEE